MIHETIRGEKLVFVKELNFFKETNQESSWNSCMKSVSPYSGYKKRTGQTKESPTRWTRFPIAAGWHGSIDDKLNASTFPFPSVTIPRASNAATNCAITVSSFFSAASAFLLFRSSSF